MASVQGKVLLVMKDAGMISEYYVVPSSLCIFNCAASTVRPGDKGVCYISSSHHCINTTILWCLGGVQVGYTVIPRLTSDPTNEFFG